MKLAPDVIFYCNMIMAARERASSEKEILPAINAELKKWNISKSKALDCIDQYLEHLSRTISERETLPKSPSDPIYLEHKRERSMLLDTKKVLAN